MCAEQDRHIDPSPWIDQSTEMPDMAHVVRSSHALSSSVQISSSAYRYFLLHPFSHSPHFTSKHTDTTDLRNHGTNTFVLLAYLIFATGRLNGFSLQLPSLWRTCRRSLTVSSVKFTWRSINQLSRSHCERIREIEETVHETR